MTHTRKFRIAAFTLPVTFAACASEGPISAGQTIAQSEYCASANVIDASPSCGAGSAAKMCQDQYACLVNLLETDAANAFLECQKPKVCTSKASPSDCKQQMALKVPSHTKESQRCFARYEECKSGSTGKDPFDDDLCEYVVGMKAAVLADYAPCFEKTCGEIQGCMQNVLNSRGLNDCPE